MFYISSWLKVTISTKQVEYQIYPFSCKKIIFYQLEASEKIMEKDLLDKGKMCYG